MFSNEEKFSLSSSSQSEVQLSDLWGHLGSFIHLFLLALASRPTTPGETKLLASEIYELLQASSSAESEPTEEAVSSRRKAQFFLGSSNKRAKTVILHIDGLDDPVSCKFWVTESSLMTSWLMTHHHVSDVNVSSWSESQEFVWGGSAEDQRRHQLHLHDDRQEMYRPDPIGPEGWGESTLFVDWLLGINETDNWYFELILICNKI